LRLPLFPEPGFEQSAMTPVLLGVVIAWMFTETFGWVFAGLVVPGYLASVFLLHPIGGLIDVIEAILTYGLARLIGEHLARTGLTSRIFGRERFFLVVVCSVLVRVVVEGVLLPSLLPRAPWAFSIGLVVVPLAANACWKTGLGKGFVQNAVPTLLVYLLLRFVLVPYTNFSLVGFELVTENVMASFLESPKAYILVLTGAAIASLANVRYGWDFNGILVPALLGLVVVEPVKLLATFIEAVILVVIGLLAMRKLSIVGPRQTVFFFAVDYALRFAFGWLLGRTLPTADMIDLMGFGYLLPTLLAVKMVQRDNIALVALPAAKTAAVSFAVGTLIGYAAMRLDPTPAHAASSGRKVMTLPSQPAQAALLCAGLGLDARPLSRAPVRVAWDRVAEDPPPAKIDAFTTDALEGGVVAYRERFDDAGARIGLPSVLVRGPSAQTRAVFVVEDAGHHPTAAFVAGALVAEGIGRAAILGQLPPDIAHRDVHLERAIAAFDRRLPVIALGTDAQGTLTVSARGPIPRATLEEISRRASLARELPAATPSDLVDLGTAAALSITLENVTSSEKEPTVEELLVMRELVFRPLLADRPVTENEIALVRVVADRFGYHVLGPAPRADGASLLAVVPSFAPSPVALVVRIDAPITRVVEVPHAADRVARDVALRLAGGLHADAILLGFRTGGASYKHDLLRSAHASAVEHARDVWLVRTDANDDIAARLGAWGRDRDRALASTRSVLSELAMAANDEPLDTHARDFASRTLPARTSLVSVTVGRHSSAAAVLATERDDVRTFARMGLRLEEMPIDDAARALGKAVEAAPSDVRVETAALDEYVRLAAVERSAVAMHRLRGLFATGAAKGALVRRADATMLVVAARTSEGSALIVAPTTAGARPSPQERRASFEECGRAISRGGLCHVGGRP
jgi:hypothetical protein